MSKYTDVGQNADLHIANQEGNTQTYVGIGIDC